MRDSRCILSIPISLRAKSDEISWALSKNGTYSVKTSYMLGKGCNLDAFHQAWLEIWSMEASPKVRHFLWRLCTNTLPVRKLLKTRHLIEDAACPWCLQEEETTAHAIFGCSRVKDLWDRCGCTAMKDWETTESMCELVASWKNINLKTKQKGVFLAWCIWSERNQKFFENRITPNDVLIERVYRMAEEYGKYTARIYTTLQPKSKSSSKIWCAPPDGIVKINADASLRDEGLVGLGAVARDNHGQVIFAATRRIKACWSPEIAEAKALVLAAKLGKKYGLKEVILESDCQLLINRLSKGAMFLSDLDSILGDILALCTYFHSVKWSHVGRDGNSVAHHLARIVPFGIEQIWENHCPREISSHILMDVMSLNF